MGPFRANLIAVFSQALWQRGEEAARSEADFWAVSLMCLIVDTDRCLHSQTFEFIWIYSLPMPLRPWIKVLQMHRNSQADNPVLLNRYPVAALAVSCWPGLVAKAKKPRPPGGCLARVLATWHNLLRWEVDVVFLILAKCISTWREIEWGRPIYENKNEQKLCFTWQILPHAGNRWTFLTGLRRCLSLAQKSQCRTVVEEPMFTAYVGLCTSGPAQEQVQTSASIYTAVFLIPESCCEVWVWGEDNNLGLFHATINFRLAVRSKPCRISRSFSRMVASGRNCV